MNAASSRGEALLGHLAQAMRPRLPQGVSPTYFDGFLTRNRRTLVQAFDAHLAELDRLRGTAPVASPPVSVPTSEGSDLAALPEHWTSAKRTAANIRAMEIAAEKRPDNMTREERLALAQYSGWGGLSIEGAAHRFPEGFPAPESRGLIHEFYTPSKVTQEILRVIAPLLPDLERDGRILALEPAAGIGRFIAPARGPAFKAVSWTAVEYSALSAQMLRALYPGVHVVHAPFERWVAQHGEQLRGQISLVVSNPPYGARGASKVEDPDRSYREGQAYAYFLRRGLDLLAEGGLGVFLIPAGFLSGKGKRVRALREKVLRRHHLSAAFRLPSGIFPGAHLVTDLLFFRARGGELDAVDPGDRSILDGLYFKDFPRHILGVEKGRDAGEEDQTSLPRWGYQVVGEFTKLPDLVERPICAACVVQIPKPPKPRASVGIMSALRGADELPEEVALAADLGERLDAYLKLAATEESQEAVALHGELVDALRGWAGAHGNPHAHKGLRKHLKQSDRLTRFVSAFEPSGRLIKALQTPPVYERRYRGGPEDVVAQADYLYRSQHRLSRLALLRFHRSVGGSAQDVETLLPKLFAAGWALDEGEILPPDVYLTGDLWPRYDRAKALASQGDERAATQARALLQAIKPQVFEDIEGISPQQGWIPLSMVAQWFAESLNKRYGAVELERVGSMVQLPGQDYKNIDEAYITPETRWCIGWMNHDRTLFKPTKAGEESQDEARLRVQAQWNQDFRAWVASDEERKAAIEAAYNHHFRGFVAPEHSAEPIPIARWTKEGIRPHPHQYAGARRILHNRGGLLAFDVGVGKTYTGIAVIARARQEGWCRRPVILVPNSIVWKWYADILRVLPDYRVGVVGSRQKVVTRGDRKGDLTSETDSPAQRARTWSRFQAGEFDVVLLTYSAMPRTKMNDDTALEYAESVAAIQREVKLRQRNAEGRKKLSEREQAILNEGVSAWVAEMLELPPGWRHDPGVTWEDLGVDLLMVDEAQNFKNLYLPEAREGGVPRFMGNAGRGSKRAWQLDFRAASVRARTGGAGVVLLSATPAKNSPLEFYNLLQFVDARAWTRLGITDPEQFIDRYLRIELKQVVDTKMEVVEGSAVVGFTNLHELREVIFRYGDFKTAEDVGLKLPEPRVEIVEVDMDPAQSGKYDYYVSAIEEAMTSADPKERGSILGYLARMALVAIHARLDEQFDWKTAAHAEVDPRSPKFEAMAERVAINRTCGHIVFVDNVAAHRWVKRVLVASGVPAERIAVLNAITAKAAADRQRIAREFNGDPAAGILPKYDVVIANAIAYEGIDLQTRTCAIHHLDLPWEPATLQQRNGRGVRQGNTLQNIAIYYYFARRSQDGRRFNLIQGKLGWMTEILKSQKRDTNNPGAQMEMGPEEILLLISRDPQKTKERLDALRAKREAEALAKVRADATRMLRSANGRFRRAESTEDPGEAARLRLEGEERLRDLSHVDPEAWPWAPHMGIARTQPIFVTSDGMPVWEGLKIAGPSAYSAERLEHAEFGRVQGMTIGLRAAGEAVWRARTTKEVEEMKLAPAHFDIPFPEGELERRMQAMGKDIGRKVEWAGDFKALGWFNASDAFIEWAWGAFAPAILGTMAKVRYPHHVQQQHVPILRDGQLQIGRGAPLAGAQALPPTQAGWQDFLTLAPASGLKFTPLDEAARYWWGRPLPRDLLASARRAEAA